MKSAAQGRESARRRNERGRFDLIEYFIPGYVPEEVAGHDPTRLVLVERLGFVLWRELGQRTSA